MDVNWVREVLDFLIKTCIICYHLRDTLIDKAIFYAGFLTLNLYIHILYKMKERRKQLHVVDVGTLIQQILLLSLQIKTL